MNSGAASLMLALGLCVALFPLLLCKPVTGASAQTTRARLASVLASFAGVPAALLLAGWLGWIAFVRLHAGAGFSLSTSLLLLITLTGIGLLPLVFPSRFPSANGILEAAARLMLGLAWASCWMPAGSSPNPDLLLLGALTGLLPDTLDHWIIRPLRRIDIHIIPDPLAPDPGLIATTLTQAIHRCHEEQRTLRLEIYPGQNQDGLWWRYRIELNNQAGNLTVRQNQTEVASRLVVRVTSHHPFTLETGPESGSLDLAPLADGRVLVTPASWQGGWSHSLVVALLAGVVTGLLFTVQAGIIGAGAWVLHILLDQSGYGATAWAFPFKAKPRPGFQLWRPARAQAFHLGLLWLGLVMTIGSMGPAALQGIGRINPALLILAGIIPLVLVARAGSKA